MIVGATTGGQPGAILLYEAALGIGLSVGPLLAVVLCLLAGGLLTVRERTPNPHSVPAEEF